MVSKFVLFLFWQQLLDKRIRHNQHQAGKNTEATIKVSCRFSPIGYSSNKESDNDDHHHHTIPALEGLESFVLHLLPIEGYYS